MAIFACLTTGCRPILLSISEFSLLVPSLIFITPTNDKTRYYRAGDGDGAVDGEGGRAPRVGSERCEIEMRGTTGGKGTSHGPTSRHFLGGEGEQEPIIHPH